MVLNHSFCYLLERECLQEVILLVPVVNLFLLKQVIKPETLVMNFTFLLLLVFNHFRSQLPDSIFLESLSIIELVSPLVVCDFPKHQLFRCYL